MKLHDLQPAPVRPLGFYHHYLGTERPRFQQTVFGVRRLPHHRHPRRGIQPRRQRVPNVVVIVNDQNPQQPGHVHSLISALPPA